MKTMLPIILSGLLKGIVVCFICTACLNDLYSQAPVVEFTEPSNGETVVSITRNPFIVFEDEIELGTGTFEIRDYNTESVVITVNQSSPNLRLSKYNSDKFNTLEFKHLFDYVLNYNTQYYITISNGLVKSKSGTDYPGFTSKAVWNFTTTGPASIFSVNHKSSGALIDPPGTFQMKISGSQLLQMGSVGNLRLIDLSNSSATLLSFNTNASEIIISNNVITVNLTFSTIDLNQYAIQWDEGYFENTAGGLIEANNGTIFDFIVYKALAPTFAYGNESFWPHDNWGDWEQENDYLNVSFDRPIKAGTGKIRIYRYSNDQLIEEIDVVADVDKIDTKEEWFGTDVDIFPATIFTPGIRYYVTWDEGVFVELSSAAHPVVAITDKDYWTFTIDGELPLEIVSLAPSNGAIAGEENPVLTMTFNKNVVAGTSAGADFIVIRDIYGSTIEYFFVTDERVTGLGTSQLTFNPNADLVLGMKYYIEFGTNIIKGEDDDIHFEGWTGDSNWSFQIGELDPYITLFSPDRFQSGVSVDLERIEFTFDRNIKINNDFGSTGISFRRSGYGAAPELDINKNSQEIEIIDNKLIIHLPRPLLYNQQYTMFFQNNFILDLDDNAFKGFNDSFYQFTTETTVDADAPSLVGILPANESTNVLTTGFEIELTFDEPIFKELGFARIRRFDDDVSVRSISLYVYSDEFQVDGNKMILKPNVTLQAGEKYYLQLAGGYMIDQNKNTFSGIDKDDYSFTTATPLPVALLATYPANEVVDVSWNSNIELEFNQPMSYTGGNGKIRLKNDANDATVISFQASQIGVFDNFVELSFGESFVFSNGAKYYLEIDADAFKSATDEFFEGFANKDDYSFTAGWDMPEVSTRNPAHNAVDVSRSQAISITFDRPIELQTEVGVSNEALFHIRLRQTPIGGGSFVHTNYFIGDDAISYTGNTLTITPNEPLDYASEVNVLILNNVVMGLIEDNGEFDHLGPLQGANSTSFYLFTTEKEPQTITFTELDDVDLNELDGNLILEATASSGLTVNFEVVSGPATLVNGNELEFSGTGIVEVKAYQPGNEHYAYAESTQEFNVFDSSKEDQTITFETIADKTFGDADFDLTANASSGLPVTFTVTAGQSLVSIDGNTLSILGAGNVTIRANQAGDEDYNAASPVSHSFVIEKADQTISIEAIADKEMDAAPFDVTASVSSGLSLTYAVEGPASIDGSTITLNGEAGTVTVTVSQAGNENYNPAEESTSFTVFNADLENQTITFNQIADKTFGDDDFELDASASSELPVSFVVTAGQSLVSLDGNVVSIIGAGNVTIRADQAGNDTYNAATSVSLSFTINKADQQISIETIEDKEIDAEPFDVVATVDSELTLAYSVEGPATISGTTITLTGETGTVTVTVSQAGNENYLAAETSISFEVLEPVAKQAQSINFPAIADRFIEEGTLNLNATASSGLSVSYEVLSGPATVAGNVVSFTGLGTVTIRASQEGNEAYLPAEPVERSFEVNTVTGVEDIQQMLNLEVYPNPVADELNIRFNKTLPVQLKLFNIYGNEVVKLSDEPVQSVNVSHLSAGMYLLRVSTSQGMLTHKILKK